jgi:hypothetical protein
VRHDPHLRWLRFKRHLRSCGLAPCVRYPSAARQTITARDGPHFGGTPSCRDVAQVVARPLPAFAPDRAT